MYLDIGHRDNPCLILPLAFLGYAMYVSISSSGVQGQGSDGGLAGVKECCGPFPILNGFDSVDLKIMLWRNIQSSLIPLKSI